jgi:hypothetical protein
MKNAKNGPVSLYPALAAVFFISALALSLSSCSIKNVFPGSERISSGTEASGDAVQSDSTTTTEISSASDSIKENRLVFFDYKNIAIETTTAIGVKLKNCNLVLDYFGNLNFLGEIENTSNSSKTSIIVTFEFFDKKNELIFSDSMPLNINYLRVSSVIPFSYTIREQDRFVSINKIKAGINYKDYYKMFTGNIVARQDRFYYKDNILNIEGRLLNIGESDVSSLFLLATFFDKKDGVVFIRECYLPEKVLKSGQEEDFTLEVRPGRYTPEFTHYDFEVFFEDSVKMP